MNFLAHLHVAAGSEQLLAGAVLADFVKGRLPGGLPPALAAGVELHRRVDSFTDRHPLARQSRRRLPAANRRAAGIAVDIVYDHFLARHWRRFADEPLPAFAARCYACLEAHAAAVPDALPLIRAMRAGDWLCGYRELAAAQRALARTARRLRRPDLLAGAPEALAREQAGLETDFLAFYPELQRFVHDERQRLGVPVDQPPCLTDSRRPDPAGR